MPILASLKRIFYEILLILSLALYFIPLKNRDLMGQLFSKAGYYCLLLVFICFVYSLIKFSAESETPFKQRIRAHRGGVLFALALAGVVFLSTPTHFRILSDEANMLSISKTMTYEKKTDNVTMGSWYYRFFVPMEAVAEKRPLFFPFVTHLLHVLLGYRIENAFLANFLFLWGIYFIVYALIRDKLGPGWAAAGTLLVAAQPALSLAANSAGIDTMNLFFVALDFVILRSFLRKPTPACFQLLWCALIVTAHCRYESIFYLFVVIAFLGIWNYIKLEYLNRSFVFSITPVLILPILWQRTLKFEDNEIPGGSIAQAFHFSYLWQNHVKFAKSLVDFSFSLPYANVVNIAGILALIYFAWRFFRSGKSVDPADRKLAFISGVSLVFMWLVITSYYSGDPTHPVSSRFFIPFTTVFSISAVFLLHRLLQRGFFKPAYAVLGAFVAFCLYHPIAVKDNFTKSLSIIRYNLYVTEFLKKQAETDRNFLVIAEFPGHFTILDYGAVHFFYANDHQDDIFTQYKQRLYSTIYVVQEIRYDTQQPTKDTALAPEFRLEKLNEIQNTPESYIRITKVVNPR